MGVFDRLILRDEQRERIAPNIIGDGHARGSSGGDTRMFIEAVLWIVRTGSSSRDLPDVPREWNSVFHRFSSWSQKGIGWWRFTTMSDYPDIGDTPAIGEDGDGKANLAARALTVVRKAIPDRASLKAVVTTPVRYAGDGYSWIVKQFAD